MLRCLETHIPKMLTYAWKKGMSPKGSGFCHHHGEVNKQQVKEWWANTPWQCASFMCTLLWIKISGRSLHQQMFILQASDKLEYTWSYILSFPATSWPQSLGKSWNKVEYEPEQNFNAVSQYTRCPSRVVTVLWMSLSYVSETGLDILVSRNKRSSCCQDFGC